MEISVEQDGEFRRLAELVALQFGYNPEPIYQNLRMLAVGPVTSEEINGITRTQIPMSVGVDWSNWIVEDKDFLKRYDWWRGMIKGQSAVTTLKLAAFFDRDNVPYVPNRKKAHYRWIGAEGC